MKNKKLKRVLADYLSRTPQVGEYCNRCLRTERWGGNVVLMVVDAAFTSIGLNYFTAVVPKVMMFREKFSEKIKNLEDLSHIGTEAEKIWKNKRSWNVARGVASSLSKIKKQQRFKGDKDAFVYWARNSKLTDWRKDIIGKINGVGINTYQYLRMMGGVDTVMPDKIVKKVIREILKKSGLKMPTENDMDFIQTVHRIAKQTGSRPIELCWMTWLVQSEGGRVRSEKYSHVLQYI